MSDVIDMLRDVPPLLAAAWGGWLAAGLMLLLWHLRAHGGERDYARLMAASRQPRTKSGGRPPSGVRRAPKAPPVDAFGELEALLEPAPTTGAHSRRPGD